MTMRLTALFFITISMTQLQSFCSEEFALTVMPVSSYALSLDRLIIWSNGKPWMLISPTNRADFIKQLRKINPNIQLK